MIRAVFRAPQAPISSEGPAVRRSDRLLILSCLLCCCGVSIHAQNGGMLGQSITWRQASSPFTPDGSKEPSENT